MFWWCIRVCTPSKRFCYLSSCVIYTYVLCLYARAKNIYLQGYILMIWTFPCKYIFLRVGHEEHTSPRICCGNRLLYIFMYTLAKMWAKFWFSSFLFALHSSLFYNTKYVKDFLLSYAPLILSPIFLFYLNFLGQ